MACPPPWQTIEYDPNRNCFISLIQYEDGEKRDILAPAGLKVGEMIESGLESNPRSAMPCRCRAFRSAWKFTMSR